MENASPTPNAETTAAPKQRKPAFWESVVPTPRFFHLRYTDEDTGEPELFGGMTIAWRLMPDAGTLHVAHTHCHENDRYVKAIGRNHAAGRLLSPNTRMVYEFTPDPLESRVDMETRVYKILDEYYQQEIKEWHLRRRLDPPGEVQVDEDKPA